MHIPRWPTCQEVRLVNIDTALHPFELVPEDNLSVGDAVIEKIDHVIVRLEGFWMRFWKPWSQV